MKPELAPRIAVILAATMFIVGLARAAAAVGWSLTNAQALQVSRATKAPLLGAARAGRRWVAVGEHGVIVLSDDEGQTWRQSKNVETVTTLTSVWFVDERHGYAVGHGGVVLETGDGGEHWRLAAGAIDGVDALLSVWFETPLHGIAVGTYGRFMETDDAGAHWNPRAIIPGEGGERHLNQIIATRGLLLIAAEGGHVFRSIDQGRTWTDVAVGVKGSLWGGLALSDGSLLVYGMSGRVLVSRDGGLNWQIVPTGTDRPITAGVQTSDGSIVLAGLNGLILSSNDGARSFTPRAGASETDYTAVLAQRGGSVRLLGTDGTH